MSSLISALNVDDAAIHKLASDLSISSNRIFDLRDHPNDIHSTWSIQDLIKISTYLNLTLPELLDVQASDRGMCVSSLSELRELVNQNSERVGGIAALSEKVGWDLSSFISQPKSILNWNADGILDLANYLDINAIALIEMLRNAAY